MSSHEASRAEKFIYWLDQVRLEISSCVFSRRCAWHIFVNRKIYIDKTPLSRSHSSTIETRKIWVAFLTVDWIHYKHLTLPISSHVHVWMSDGVEWVKSVYFRGFFFLTWDMCILARFSSIWSIPPALTCEMKINDLKWSGILAS